MFPQKGIRTWRSLNLLTAMLTTYLTADTVEDLHKHAQSLHKTLKDYINVPFRRSSSFDV